MAFQESESHWPGWIRNPRLSGFLIRAKEGKARKGKESIVSKANRSYFAYMPTSNEQAISRYGLQRVRRPKRARHHNA